MGLLAWMRRQRGEQHDPAEAQAALERATAARRESAERRPEVAEITSRLRHLRERNHFAEMIERALRGGA
jgi:hypothetical protein